MSQMEEVIVEVIIQRDRQTGVVRAVHRLKSEDDQHVLMSWPSGGLEQMAFGLVSVAVMREAILDVILEASKDSTVISRFRNLSEQERTDLETKLVGILTKSMSATIDRLAPQGIRVALDQINKPG